MNTDLSTFSIRDYKAGKKWKILLWYPFNYFLLDSSLPWPGKLKTAVLRLFGAQIGTGLVLKPRVRIKYPWRFSAGNYCWIGEDVWIDNLETVTIGSNVCISQGALLLTGNHDYNKTSFPYRLGRIVLEDGVWIGAKSVVCPGVTCKSHAILTVNSVATKDLDAMFIYSGNPAIKVRSRNIVE